MAAPESSFFPGASPWCFLSLCPLCFLLRIWIRGQIVQMKGSLCTHGGAGVITPRVSQVSEQNSRRNTAAVVWAEVCDCGISVLSLNRNCNTKCCVYCGFRWNGREGGLIVSLLPMVLDVVVFMVCSFMCHTLAEVLMCSVPFCVSISLCVITVYC